MKGAYFDSEDNILSRECILIVEGVDDASFLECLLKDIGADPARVSIAVAKGKDLLGSLVGAMLKNHAFTSGVTRTYAVIRDADESVEQAKKEAKAIFDRFSEPVPDVGAFAERNDGRRVGLFLFPGDEQPGDLEELCMRSVHDGLAAQAANFVAGIGEQGGKTDHLSKRTAQTYLAVASLPLCAGVGWAMKKGVFDVSSPQLEQIKSFLRELTGL